MGALCSERIATMGGFTCCQEARRIERRRASAVEGYRTPRRFATPDGLSQNVGLGGPETARTE